MARAVVAGMAAFAVTAAWVVFAGMQGPGFLP